MQPCEGERTLAIDQSSDVGGVRDTQRMDHGSIRKKAPPVRRRGLVVGWYPASNDY